MHSVTAAWVWFLWMLYPVCWGISEGGNVIAPDSEFIFYGILDCMLIPVTAGFFLFRHWRIDPARMGLKLRTYDDPLDRHRVFAANEKPVESDSAAGAAPATTEEAQPSAAAV